METIIQFLFEHAAYAHWIVFGALMLAGFNIPISEDLMIIMSALLASTVIPENTAKLFLAVFLGCYLSDWVCYGIGRTLGRRLWSFRFFAKTFDPKRLDQIQNYYEKYGIWTLILGRFIPFGVRNGLFLTAGMGRMPFLKFILSDGLACLISNTTLFTLTYTLGRNYTLLFGWLKAFNLVLFALFLITVISVIWYKRRQTQRAARSREEPPL